MMTSVSAPDSRDVRMSRNSQKNSMPTSPYMIDGMPERVSAAYSMAATTLRFRAYSVRYTAAPTPSGRTTARDVRSICTVLHISGRMPMVPAT